MFSKPTVFILGAGAAVDFQFPAATGLNERVIDWVRTEPAIRELNRITSSFPAQARELGRNLDVAQISIDRWLTQQADFINVGRYCIARFIAAAEQSSPYLWHHWYAALWRSLMPPVPCYDWQTKLLENQIYFITFNYDRTLEHCLINKIMSTYRVQIDAAATVVNRMNILHVYGQIGRLPWQSNDGFLRGLSERKYGISIDPDNPSGLEIKVISEVKREDTVFETARRWLLEAKRVHFLGFACHPENLERLKFGTGVERRGQITGTCVGLSDTRISDLENSGAEFGIPILFPKGKVGIETYFSEVVEG